MNWAMVNRLACELLHRGVEPPRLTLDERDDDLPDIALSADDVEDTDDDTICWQCGSTDCPDPWA